MRTTLVVGVSLGALPGVLMGAFGVDWHLERCSATLRKNERKTARD